MYNLPENYVARLEPDYFNDTLSDSASWQADIYRLAAQLARTAGIKRLVDIGCGRGEKLLPYASEFELTGIDYGANIDYLQMQSIPGTWVSKDLGRDFIGGSAFDDSVVICADIIEHLPDPSALIQSLKNAVSASSAAYVLVSTPDRARVYKQSHFGPPGNPCHVREWTNEELQAWFTSEGLPIVWAGWTVSNDSRPDQVWTNLLILSNRHSRPVMPFTFEPHPAFKVSPYKQGDSRLKVWMTPTPREAAHDTTNAIHQIVCRLDGLLGDYGVQLVEQPEGAILKAGHAGQGSTEQVDVAHYHGLYNTAEGHNSKGFFAINSHVIANLRSAKIITAPSEWIADVIRRDMHINPRIVGWGVDTTEWTPAQNPGLYVLWNKARVDAISDPAPMLELAKRVPDMPFLTTFGEGGENVRTIGRQPYEAMKNYVRNSSVYLATVTETFGIATVEAMASGVPVLGFRHGNTACLVEHGINGFLAEPGDFDGLAEGLIYCMKYRDRLGANAREAAKYYTWERVAESMASIYREVIHQPEPGVKVSIVIPCHNYERYVIEAVESALVQTPPFAYEIIVVLDRCTDNSRSVLEPYSAKGVRLLTADNGNLSATRNQGIAAAQGKYIVLLDADDRLGSPLFLQTLADALDKDRGLGIAFTSIRIIDADGNLGHINPWPDGYDFDQQAQRRNQVPSCCMFRKEAWKRAGGFRPWFKYAEDAEFWTTVGTIGYRAAHVVRDGWFQYRLHNQSASQVHRTGEIPEPDWLEYHPWAKDGQRPFAADGKPPSGSWPVRFYLKPDVSIIIPVGKGHEEILKDALHSVEGQTHRYWECIVVNDTGAKLDLSGFPWAKVVTTTGSIGAGAARNLGARHADAPFVVFLDADDLLKPRFLEQTLTAYRHHGRYIYTDWMTDDRRGHTEFHPMPDYSLDAFQQRASLHAVTALIPTRWFFEAGGFDETLAAYEDVDFYLRMRTLGYCGHHLAQPLLVYNLDTGFRRSGGATQEAAYLNLLKERFADYMEGKKPMCDCVLPPKGLPPVPPTLDNAAQYRETYGDMVKIRLTWAFAPGSPVTFRGPATKVDYGARAKDDVFYVWEADFINSDGVFSLLEDFQPEPMRTVIPPEPPEPPEVSPSDMIFTEVNAIETPAEPKERLEGMTVRQLKAFAEEWGIVLTKAQQKNRDTLLAAIVAQVKSDA